MKGRIMRLLPLFALMTFFIIAIAEDQLHQAEQHAGVATRLPVGSSFPEQSEEDAPPQSQTHDATNSKGADMVEEAMAILRLMPPALKPSSRANKSSGIIASAAYYSKELFFLLFMNGPPSEQTASHKASEAKLSEPLSKAVKLLERAAEYNNSDAIYLLAEMNFYGNFSHPRNYVESFKRYNDLASLYGNSSAQHMVGFMYATGIGGAVQRDQAKALLYHTFAALGGNTRSEMTVAFRHHSGIGTPRNCDEAVFYYKRVADKAIAYARSGEIGGRLLSQDAYRLADAEGGPYGEGASVSSSGINAIKGGPNSDAHASIEDVIEYLDLLSKKSDLKATMGLARLYYKGKRDLKQDLKLAKKYFMKVAREHWAKDGSIIEKSNQKPGTEKLAAAAAGYLGRMFMRGEGMEQSFEKALIWYRRGLKYGDSVSQTGIGLMYLHGYGVPQDAVKAADYFKAAADQDSPIAQVKLGELFLDQGDDQVALRYFDLAVRHGSMEAYYYLAELINQGIGRERSCGLATAYYKIVAENAESIHSSFIEANEAYEEGDIETALIGYLMGAEQGYEIAQANVAWMLDEQKSKLRLGLTSQRKTTPSAAKDASLALIHWTRSSKQANLDSMVKMGDYYLYGIGTHADNEKAATCYQAAAEHQQSAQALYNLGWMHENGIGVEQDFHLAKRYYDLALDANEEAYLPVKLSLLKLRMRSFWNTITNGRVNSIREEPEEEKDWSFTEWIANFLRDEQLPYKDVEDEFSDQAHEPGMPGGDDDWYDDANEGILDSLIIVGLLAALAFLVYYRQQRQMNHQRVVQEQNQAQREQGQEQRPQEQQDRGMFPREGDPDFMPWLAGGIGH